jgi:hypothetical protein
MNPLSASSRTPQLANRPSNLGQAAYIPERYKTDVPIFAREHPLLPLAARFIDDGGCPSRQHPGQNTFSIWLQVDDPSTGNHGAPVVLADDNGAAPLTQDRSTVQINCRKSRSTVA